MIKIPARALVFNISIIYKIIAFNYQRTFHADLPFFRKIVISRCFSSDPNELFHDGSRYHIETSPLICRANQWTGFYMITASVMKELIVSDKMKPYQEKNAIY